MKKYYILVAATLLSYSGFGQQVFNSAGITTPPGNFILDWSVGELTLVQTVQNGSLTFTQGVLQGKILVFETAASAISDGEFKILPNPTPGILYLQAGFLEKGKLAMLLYNAAGQKILSREDVLTGFVTKNINMSAYAAGTYLLQISFRTDSGNERKRTYKIVKL
jgi:hypothetical protein